MDYFLPYSIGSSIKMIFGFGLYEKKTVSFYNGQTRKGFGFSHIIRE